MGEQHSPGAVTEAPHSVSNAPIAELQVQVMFMLPHVASKMVPVSGHCDVLGLML